MKFNPNNRQKLVLDRVRKTSTPQKLEIEAASGYKVAPLHAPLAHRDSNIMRLNSSIFRKQCEIGGERRSMANLNLLRCRSISCIDQNIKIPLRKICSNLLEEQPAPKSTLLLDMIHCVSREVVLQFKDHSILTAKHNSYCLSAESMEDLLLQFGQKLVEKVNAANLKMGTDENQSSKHSSSMKQSKKGISNFKIVRAFSFSEHFKSRKQLSYQSSIINLHAIFESMGGEKEMFRIMVQNFSTDKSISENLGLLCDKIKYTKLQINNQESKLKKMQDEVETATLIIGIKKKEANALEDLVKRREDYLQKIEKAVKDIEGFISKQPNRILQQEAEGYKQREQELFDLAFLLEQSTPQSLSTFIEESIMIPFESFKLTLNSFFNHQIDENANYLIGQADMESFKASINTAYESTINKLKAIIEAKGSKIKNFVGIMRRLASYTIGKREYLTEINKKMAVVSVNADKRFKLIEESLVTLNATDQTMKSFLNLKELISCMRSIYCEAEVFY